MRPLFSYLLFLGFLANVTFAHASDNSVPLSVSRYLKQQGPVTESNTFFNSARNQLVAFFCVDENLPGGANEGASNPANVHCGVALFNKKSGKWVLGDERGIGQGAVKEFTSNSLITETVEYDLSKDALCCPSIRNEKVFYIRDGKFSETKP